MKSVFDRIALMPGVGSRVASSDTIVTVLLVTIIVLLAVIAVLACLYILHIRRYKRESEIDIATGVGNRMYLLRGFESIPADQRSEYAMICFNLDSERVERAFGRDVYISYVKNAIEAIKAYSTKDDLFARVIGAGLVVLARVSDDRINRGILNILEHARDYDELRSGAFNCKVSAGVYRLKETDDDINEIIFYAWQTANKAAKSDLDYLFCTEEMIGIFINERYLRKEIVRGFENREFVTYIQFCVDTDSCRIVGGEALTRWKHPRRGIVSPAEFIPFMERENLISRMDYYNLEEVCKFLNDMSGKGITDLFISCNFSRKTFAEESFVDNCKQILSKYDFPTSMLVFEITESAHEKHVAQINKNALALKEIGIRILLDDFGEGFASFYDLHEYPIDGLKLDKVLVDNYDTKKGKAILSSMARMGHELNMTVVVEGVESDEQVQALQNIKCDIIQGFRFHRPIPVPEAREKLLAEVSRV